MQKTTVKSTTFVLIDQQPSAFIKQGTETLAASHQIRLMAPSLQRIPNTSQVWIDNKLVKTRYIAGCETINQEEQVKMGIEQNPANDQIWMSNGRITVVDDGPTAMLHKYLTTACYCEGATGRNAANKPTYRISQPEKQAHADNVLNRMKAKAYTIVEGLMEETTDGKFSYDEERIDFLVNLFNMQGAPTYEEKVRALGYMAEVNPTELVESIANKEAVINATVSEMVNNNVVNISGDGAFLQGSDTPFMKFKAKVKEPEAKKKAIATYFLSNEGSIAYKQAIIDLDKRNLEALATK